MYLRYGSVSVEQRTETLTVPSHEKKKTFSLSIPQIKVSHLLAV